MVRLCLDFEKVKLLRSLILLTIPWGYSINYVKTQHILGWNKKVISFLDLEKLAQYLQQSIAKGELIEMDVLPLFYFRYKYKLKYRKHVLLDKYIVHSYELINILLSILFIPVEKTYSVVFILIMIYCYNMFRKWSRSTWKWSNVASIVSCNISQKTQPLLE